VDNIGFGFGSLDGLTDGSRNSSVGHGALTHTTSGDDNTAVGSQSLFWNETGSSNTAVGRRALFGVPSASHAASSNTAIGNSALLNTTADDNTAIGSGALASNTTGTDNVAVGRSAGSSATTGSNNIYLGANVFGVAGESNTMYLGRVGTQTRTFIAGVRGIQTVNANAIPVLIDSAGQLGTVSSSRRYKEDIQDMAGVSQRLLDLRPVTFRYTQPFSDGAKPVQFGLIAEEVADVFPELVVRDEEGRPETVQYQNLSVLLLNELQKLAREHRTRIEVLERELAALRQDRRQ
jgi:hypothetical protein